MRLMFHPRRVIHNEAQFAKFIYDRCGCGKYFVISYYKGISNFWYGECFDDGFIRLKSKDRSPELKEINNLKREELSLRQKLNESEDVEEKEMLKNDLISLQDDIKEEENEYIKKKKKKPVGPSRYIDISKPVGVKHSYQDYEE